eukprot:m.240407 g.240407  ORF g.240407 m.240407 type:complete len:231 (-) comp26279_c0_seq3:1558-2250(-)
MLIRSTPTAADHRSWTHRIFHPALNLTVTYFNTRDNCKLNTDKLLSDVLAENPTILLFNAGLHLLHMIDNRRNDHRNGRLAEPCGEQVWTAYENWLDHVVRTTATVPIRVFLATPTVGDDEYAGRWRATVNTMQADPLAVWPRCREMGLSRRYCTDAAMAHGGAERLNARARRALALTDVDTLPYDALTIPPMPPEYRFDRRHHRGPGEGGALSMTRVRMLADLLALHSR